MNTQISKKMVGGRVEVARKAKGWNQNQLADALGVKSRQIVSAIERGERALKTSELINITEVLGRDIEFFLDPCSVVGEAKFSWRDAVYVNVVILCF